MPFLIDDVVALGIPALWLSIRAARRAKMEADGQIIARPNSNVAACRAAVPVEPGLKSTSAMRGGHIYSGSDPEHVAYVQSYLDARAAQASGEDVRRILAFRALQGREGSTAAINTYDNQVLTWGTGWGGLGALPAVMDRLVTSSPEVVARLAECGVWYLGHGQWAVDDGSGNIVQGKREALEVIRQTPALLNLFIQLAKDPLTRDAVTEAQLATFMSLAGNVPASEQIATQALFNFVTHLRHWAPGYMAGAVESAATAVPGAPSAERDRAMTPRIVEHFYARSSGWIPDWRQMQTYALRDLKADGLDVSNDPVLAAASHPPANVKTAGGCGQNWASFKTAGGCGNYDYPDPSVCGSWAPFDSAYLHTEYPDARPVKIVGGPGADGYYSYDAPEGDVPPGFEHAYEVVEEPAVDVYQVAGGAEIGSGWGETFDPRDPYRHLRTAQGPGGTSTEDQVALVKRGIVEAVRNGEHDPIRWTQIQVGDYDLVVSNEPITVKGLRLPTSMEDAIAISKMIGALPITPAISDARWNQAKRVYAQPLNDATGALHDDPDQVIRYNKRMGPNTGQFVDGYWKEVVVVPNIKQSGRGSMAQYGFKLQNSMFEHGGLSNHDRLYKDYSNTPTYVSRTALKNGVEVDLLNEYAAGGPLGGPLPAWLVSELRGEVGA